MTTSSLSFTAAARAVILGTYKATCIDDPVDLGPNEIAITPDRIVLGVWVEDWLLALPHLPIHIASHQRDVLLCGQCSMGPGQGLNVEHHAGLAALGLGPVSAFQGLFRKQVHAAELVVMAGRPAVLIPGALMRSIYPQFQRDGIYWSTRAVSGAPIDISAEAWGAMHRPATAAEFESCRCRQYLAGVA